MYVLRKKQVQFLNHKSTFNFNPPDLILGYINIKHTFVKSCTEESHDKGRCQYLC